MSADYVTVTCADCMQTRSILRNGKPLPQRCRGCAQQRRSKTPKKSRTTAPTSRTSDKARLRDRFLEAFRDTDTPCKKEPDIYVSAMVAERNHAKKLCRTDCDLIDACRAWASEPPREKYGVLGGRDWTTKEKT